ncbi:MAG: BTAD domain-containing putative transcriptional regulator [Dermatophilaceae bacterium]
MHIQLLGPVQIVDGTAPADEGTGPVSGVRRKCVLAVLALRPGQVVTTDRLVEAVWGEDPPMSAHNTLQRHVSHLRGLLPGGSVTTHAATGYALSMPGECTDLQAFRRHLARASDTADAETVARELTVALAGVRGAPLADVRSVEQLERHAVRLEEQVLAAREALARARLQLGQHAAVVDELARLAAEHPFAEGLQELSILARYRCGQQADALAAYRATKTLLDEELGIEPGPRLRALELAMLRQDPRLQGPAPARTGRRAAGHDPVRPPLPVGLLVGREREQDALVALLAAERVVTVVGTGGVGKTSLVVRVCAAVRDRFPGGLGWADLAAVASEGVCRAVTDALGVAWEGPSSYADAVEAAVGSRRALLVLDSCEHVVGEVADLVSTLTSRCPGLVVLATSRERLRVVGEVVAPMAPLPVPDVPSGLAPSDLEEFRATPSVELLCRLAVAAEPGFALTLDNASAVARICRDLDGLPLALELAAARLRSMTAAELAAGLDDRFAVLTGGPRTAAERHHSLVATVAWSHRLLAEDERRFYERFAAFRDGAALAQAKAVCGVDDSAGFHRIVSGLVDKSLLVPGQRAGRTRLRMHESIRAHAFDELARSGAVARVDALHAAAFGVLADDACEDFHGPGEGMALDRLEADDANLQKALAWACEHDPALAQRMGGRLWWYWFRTGRASVGRSLLARASAGGSCLDPAAVGGRGYLAWVEDDFDEALELARRVLDEPTATAWDHGLALGVRARAEGDLGRFADAFASAQASVTRFAEAGDRWAVAWSRRCGASALVYGGDPTAALAEASRALSEFEDAGDAWGSAGALDLLGTVTEQLGDPERASRLARAAVERYRDLNDSSGTRLALQHLAEAARSNADAAEALSSARDALDIAQRHGYRVGALQALLVLADVADDPAEALGWAQQAHTLARRLGDSARVSQAVELAARARVGRAD